MNKESLHNVRLGVFVVAGLFLLIVGLYFIGDNKNMFSSTFRLVSVFTDVNGLTTGNNVRYSGIDVGTVDKIEFRNDTSVYVIMIIDEKMKKFIRKNSIASIGTDGLMGNKLVSIDPGTTAADLVSNNDEIATTRGINTDAMLRTLEFTNQNVALISANLKNITENIDKGRGTLYTVLMDTTLAVNFRNTLGNIESVSNHLNEVSSQLSLLVRDVNLGKGTLGVLLKDSGMASDFRVTVSKIKESSEKFSAITNEANTVVSHINNGKGTLSTVINDTAMANNMKQSMVNLKSASKKLDEDLEALQHNFLLRGFFKKQEKLKQKAAQSK